AGRFHRGARAGDRGGGGLALDAQDRRLPEADRLFQSAQHPALPDHRPRWPARDPSSAADRRHDPDDHRARWGADARRGSSWAWRRYLRRGSRPPRVRALPCASGARYPSASLLFFTFAASTYTSPPISLNFRLISAMPASRVPLASGSIWVVSSATSTSRSLSFAA